MGQVGCQWLAHISHPPHKHAKKEKACLFSVPGSGV